MVFAWSRRPAMAARHALTIFKLTMFWHQAMPTIRTPLLKTRTLFGLGVRGRRGDGSGHRGLLRRDGCAGRGLVCVAAGY